MITKDTTVVNDTDVDRGIPNASWGLIKDHTLQLRDGYLNRTPLFQFILLSICFPMWGMAASMNDILITQFKAVFALSDLASAFVQSAFYGGFFLIAIPASRVIRRTSYKTGLLIGLSVYISRMPVVFPGFACGYVYGILSCPVFHRRWLVFLGDFSEHIFVDDR